MAAGTPASTRRGKVTPAAPEHRPINWDAPAGRGIPQSVEAEESLLACCLLDGSDSIARCLESKLPVEAFYHPANRLIFELLCELYQRRGSLDETVVVEEMKSRRLFDTVGGYAYFANISGRIATTAHATYFLEKVREKYILRRLIQAATTTIEGCYEFQDGIEEFVDGVERHLFEVTQDRISDAAKPINASVSEAVTIVHKLLEKKGELTGVPTGFIELDRMTFGFQRQEMIVLAARPSMGKTSLALNIAEAASMPRRGQPVPTLVFSLEMSSAQLAMRLLCGRARINMVQLRNGLTKKEELQTILQTADELNKAPLWIDDSSQLSIMEMRAKARRLHARQKLGFVVVDYLQLISGIDPKVQREQQIAEISRGLKAMAKELNLPVLVLSQLNRESEKEKRQPRLSDLRESGSIEQDADVVLLLARPRDAKDDFSVATDSAELIVAKQRNGPVGEFKLTFIREITRFENYTQ